MDYSSIDIGSVELNSPDVERKGGIDIKVQGRELEPDFDIVDAESPSRFSIASSVAHVGNARTNHPGIRQSGSVDIRSGEFLLFRSYETFPSSYLLGCAPNAGESHTTVTCCWA